MNELFLEKEMETIISDVYEMDKKPLKAYLLMLGRPKTVKDFLELFKKALDEGTSQQTICFKIIEKVRSEDFFPFLMGAVKDTSNHIQAQTAFKSTVMIPDDVEMVKSYIPVILKVMERNIETEVIYHGVCLIYRIITKFPELEEDINKQCIVLSYDEMNKIMKKFDILDKWQTEGHRGKSKPGFLDKQEPFMDFALKFIKFQ